MFLGKQHSYSTNLYVSHSTFIIIKYINFISVLFYEKPSKSVIISKGVIIKYDLPMNLHVQVVGCPSSVSIYEVELAY